MGYLVTNPKADRSDTVQRFTPKLWTLDMPLEASGSVRTVGADGLDASAVFRRNGDIVGIMWNTNMTVDHPRFRYEARQDYTGCILEFTIELSGATSRLDSLYGMSLVIDTADGAHYYVRLWNYRTDPSNLSPYAQRIRIPFTADLFGGYAPTLSTDSEAVKSARRVPTSAITRLMLPMTPRDYLGGPANLGATLANGDATLTVVTYNGATLVAGDIITIPSVTGGGVGLTVAAVTSSGGVHTVATTAPYSGPDVAAGRSVEIRTQTNVPLLEQNECKLSLRSIRVSGSNTTLLCDLRPEPAHRLRMTDGFDNCYNLSPEFVVDRVYSLGYREHYVLYMGISHFQNFSWVGDRWRLTTTGELVNTPTREWFADFCERLRSKGYALWCSMSYEILASLIPVEWQQLNTDGVAATTGWVPPSSLVEPSNTEGATYLATAAKRFLGLMQAAGLPLQYQIGEPWWWDGSYSDGKPCVYSLATLTKYFNETGNYAPTPHMTSTSLSPEELALHRPYLEWLGRQLGESTNTQINIIKATYPNVKTAILVFTPQVLNPAANASAIMNLPPADQWGPSKFDVLQIEDYDWVTAGEFGLMEGTWTMATQTLGYPLSRIQYFSGFVLNPTDRHMWAYVDAAIEIGLTKGAAQTYVWSREQVMRDGYVYQRRKTPSTTISTNAKV